MKYLGNVVNAYKVIAKDYIKPGMTVVDATCGNGNDTLFLKSILNDTGKLYALDIQIEAVLRTKKLLNEHGYNEDETLSIMNRSHENFDFIPDGECFDFVVYNLGYLPKGDKTITTQYKTTLMSLNSALSKLNSGGLVVVLCYRGHESGAEEAKYLEDYLSSLEQKAFDVCQLDFINQKNAPPIMWIIEKK